MMYRSLEINMSFCNKNSENSST